MKKIKPTRLVAGAALGAVGASVGIAAGIATGDPTKVKDYAITGGLAGNKAGRGIASAFGVEEAIEAVNQANMDELDKKEQNRREVMNSDKYRMQMDRENRQTRKFFNQKMTDGRTLREACIDEGLTYEQQEQLHNYYLDDQVHQRYSDIDSGNLNKADHESLVQNFFSEAINAKKASESLGVTNFDQLDSSTRQSKMEHIAKNNSTDKDPYKRLKERRDRQEAIKDAATSANDKLAAKREIDSINEQIRALSGVRQITDNINSWGRAGEK